MCSKRGFKPLRTRAHMRGTMVRNVGGAQGPGFVSKPARLITAADDWFRALRSCGIDGLSFDPQGPPRSWAACSKSLLGSTLGPTRPGSFACGT